MTSKTFRGADLRDEQGIYRYNRREYPGVTKCLSVWGSWEHVYSAAVHADANRLADAFDNGEYMTAWRQDDTGAWRLTEVPPIDYLRHDLKGSGARRMKGYKDRGTVLHGLLEGYAQGERVEAADVGEWLEERIYGARMSCSVDECLLPAKGIVRWLDEYAPTFFVSECPAFNDTVEVAGKPDGILACDKIANGAMLWVDLKPGFERSHIRQLSAYAHMEFFLHGDESGYAEWPAPEGLDAIVLQYDANTGKIGHRMVSSDMLEWYWHQEMLPIINAYKAVEMSKGPLPQNKAVWLK